MQCLSFLASKHTSCSLNSLSEKDVSQADFNTSFKETASLRHMRTSPSPSRRSTTNTSVYLALNLSYHYISSSMRVCTRLGVSAQTKNKQKQDRIWTGSCLRWIWWYEKCEEEQANEFNCWHFISFPHEFLPLCVFVVGKFIWVFVRLVKHGHNRPILWHIQQRAFLCVCHTLRKTHANKHCDDLTTHAQTFVFHISVI